MENENWYSIEAEQSVLGSIMIRPEILASVMGILDADDFYRVSHRELFHVFLSMAEDGTGIDLVTVTEELKKKGRLQAVGGVSFVVAIANLVPTAANYEHYCNIVKEYSFQRRGISVLNSYVRALKDKMSEDVSIIELLMRCQSDIADIVISQKKGKAEIKQPEELWAGFLDSMTREKGVLSGFPHLDYLTYGFQKGDYIILAARPSMGKTALALQIALNAARLHVVDRSSDGDPVMKKDAVLFFSLEQTMDSVRKRILSIKTGIQFRKIQRYHLEESEKDCMKEALMELADMPLRIVDHVHDVRDICAISRSETMKGNVDLIIIDYLQFISSGNRHFENRNVEMSRISHEIKELSHQLNVPIIALSQLSRGIERDWKRRPQLSDLRDSGSLEQDADIVMFLHRDAYYAPKESQEAKKRETELILAKQRNGELGKIPLVANLECMKFWDPKRWNEENPKEKVFS